MMINVKVQDVVWDGFKGKKGVVVVLDYIIGVVLVMVLFFFYDFNEFVFYYFNDII